MEIRVKTHEEFQRDRVTIEITGTGAEVREMVSDAQAAEAVSAVGHKAMEDASLREELARRAGIIKRLENKVDGYDTDRHTERDRADRERKRASELKDRLSSSDERVRELTDKLTYLEDLGEQLTEAENQVAALKRRIDNARTLLASGNVAEARLVDSTRHGQVMAMAIAKALDTLA